MFDLSLVGVFMYFVCVCVLFGWCVYVFCVRVCV